MHDEIRAAIQQYVDGCAAADPALVRDVFDEGAVMWGYLGDRYTTMTGAEFADAVVAEAEPAGTAYTAEIRDIDVHGGTASAVLEEHGFLGLDFHNRFGLIRRDGRWRIVSKVFTTR
ncbi:nuclear transport factor 2 family protein [Leucobacter allii]|uniref:nuclear transport factor 2 family protein n=1 Tax=Leucobacter allii TaxID=2932247 RepID=UPI001FD5441E|nr:nuclear transport factor 2 family protein [Leucobacter allii]UOR00513.1 nuclear transport factor 2 family protein [Leucobacter allii]